jgi:hypothetical protein
MICILEDNDERVRQFQAAAAAIAPDLPVRIWRSARTMMADLTECLEHATIISLDNDLNPLPSDADDPGSGYDVAKLLEELIPCCPIIIHTSNAERGRWIEGALSMSGWTYDRVYPFGDDWIAKDWTPLVRRRLGR